MSCFVNPTVFANSLREPIALFLVVSSKNDRLAKFELPLKTSMIPIAFRKENETLLRNLDGPYFFPTPRWATFALIGNEKFKGDIWECACGDGTMSRVLEETNRMRSA
jgi:hypothetical protein